MPDIANAVNIAGAKDVRSAFDFEVVTALITAVQCTVATFAPDGSIRATVAVITTEDDAIRWREDGSNPTATVGHLLEAGGIKVISGHSNIVNFRAIRDTNAVANVPMSISYYK